MVLLSCEGEVFNCRYCLPIRSAFLPSFVHSMVFCNTKIREYQVFIYSKPSRISLFSNRLAHCPKHNNTIQSISQIISDLINITVSSKIATTGKSVIKPDKIDPQQRPLPFFILCTSSHTINIKLLKTFQSADAFSGLLFLPFFYLSIFCLFCI